MAKSAIMTFITEDSRGFIPACRRAGNLFLALRQRYQPLFRREDAAVCMPAFRQAG